MKHCTACGSELKSEQEFCINCGSRVNKISHNHNDHTLLSNSQSADEPFKTQPRQPNSRKKVILIGSIIGIFIVIIGSYQFLANYFDPVNHLKKMEAAIAANDVDTFMSLIVIEEDILLDKESYFQYIKDHEWEHAKRQYQAILEEAHLNQAMFIDPVQSMTGDTLFKVEKNPVLFSLFSSYSLVAVPGQLTASTTMDDTVVTFMGEKYILDSEGPVEIATTYPGEFEFIGSYENNFGEFLIEEVVTIYPGSDYEKVLEFPTETYRFQTDLPDATLFINGQDSGMKLSDINELGPFPNQDTEIYASWENPDGEVFTSDVMIIDQIYWGEVYFLFDDVNLIESEQDDDTFTTVFDADEIGDIVLDFRDAYEMALNDKDFGLISQYLRDGSEAFKELDTYIADLQDTSYHYDFVSNQILDVSDKTDGIVEVITQELFTFTNHLNNVTDYDREKIYTLEHVEDTYKISIIEYTETNREKR